MSTHAAASKQWTDAELDSLMVENEFRLRGVETTRLDTFVDAAFAFALTMLVISFDEIPSNYQEMLTAVKRIPAFAASFVVLMIFWRQHRKWSRWYGLENAQTIVLSLTLIFVMLVYVYPLRMIFEGLFSHLSDGYLTTSYRIETYNELRMIFVFYSVGFLAMSFILSLLFRAAVRSAIPLSLNELERRKTNVQTQEWAVAAALSLLPITLALILPDRWVILAGYSLFLLIPAMAVPQLLDSRRAPTGPQS